MVTVRIGELSKDEGNTLEQQPALVVVIPGVGSVNAVDWLIVTIIGSYRSTQKVEQQRQLTNNRGLIAFVRTGSSR